MNDTPQKKFYRRFSLKPLLRFLRILFTWLSIIFIGIAIPFELGKYDRFDAVAIDDGEKAFAQEASFQAGGAYDGMPKLFIYRLKILKIAKDVQLCENNRTIQYIGFIRPYTLFSIPYFYHLVVYEDNIFGHKIHETRLVGAIEFLKYIDSPKDAASTVFPCPSP